MLWRGIEIDEYTLTGGQYCECCHVHDEHDTENCPERKEEAP